ncbi:UNVERIFIED_CONTAM: Calmodulin binding protein PICBP [Sesamum calycinum]|uniref:Calmodulin binding protein PICBP n=1 Tax=Sesamum calycinum TaxID=2727403 RepID=A0AAW2R6R6_9LAMI
MVQRKLPIKPDHVKPEKNLFHHQDLKPRGAADLTKKMKKSGSFKQPGKPPPTDFVTPRKPSPVSSMTRTLNYMNSPEKSPPGLARQTGTVTPQKASPSGSLAVTPNYMKPTTSSDARKEVSTRSPQTSPVSSSLQRKGSKNSKLGLASGNKATKTFSRTEAEGTSAVKVCPYTYCSLNGHKHAPLPPLKCFLSARRRMIKNQRGLKLGCLSPRRVKCVADGLKFDEKLVMQDALKSSGTSLLRDEDEEETDFFVEIFSKEKGDTADYTGIDGSDETAAEDQEERALEGLSDAAIWYDVDADETVDENGYADGNGFADSAEAEVDDGVSPPPSVSGESTLRVQFYELDSEASDMEWETGHHSALTDPEAGEVENHVTHDDFMVEPDNKGDCFDEFSADDVPQESFDEESLNTDAFSSSSDSESTGSYEYLQGMDNMETSATGEVPPEEPEPASDDKNHILSECNQTPRIGFHQVRGHEVSEGCQVQTELSDEDLSSDTENRDDRAENIMTSTPEDTARETDSEFAQLKSTGGECQVVHKVEAANAANQETEDSGLARETTKCKKQILDGEELGAFNPRAPNFLPLEPDPEAEKVDLRHQELDGRKNAEEWMVDYALRQAVTKLAPARKRKVALLVEAFEKVMPITNAISTQGVLQHSTMRDQFRHATDMIICSAGGAEEPALLKMVSKQEDRRMSAQLETVNIGSLEGGEQAAQCNNDRSRC